MASQSESVPLLRTCSNLASYLRTLEQDRVAELFRHPATCLALFRELPPLAQQFVMRLLFVEQSVPQAVATSWVTSRHRGMERAAAAALSELGIWSEEASQGGMPAWRMDSAFRGNLKKALLGGGEPWLMQPMPEPDPNRRDPPYLDQYAQDRWNTVLHYMVGSSQDEGGISHDAVNILIKSGLIVMTEGGSKVVPSITRAGFQFLLMDTPSQVWYFILQYLDSVEERNMDLAECLNFLFQLSFATLGQDYSTHGLSQNLLAFLQHLREFGLVYQRKRSAGRFYPTRLALDIASGEAKSLLERHREGFVVVETNYRVYAYTTSDLQIALVNLFAEMLYRLPNLAVAVITRDSVRMALRGGITAAQIVRFLRMHAHAQQQKANAARSSSDASAAGDGASSSSSKPASDLHNLIPPTVVDQIYLWEKERNRFNFVDGVLYNQFLSQGDFETVRKFAESQEVVVWSNPSKRTLVVTREGHDSVKKFWRRHSKGGAGS